MLKLEINKLQDKPNNDIEFFSNDYPLPVTYKINNHSGFSEIVYVRNIDGENFIEFRFNKDNKNLKEISLVSVQDDIPKRKMIQENSNDFYLCKLIVDESIIDDTLPLEVVKSKNNLEIIFLDFYDNIKYFSLGEYCSIGINEHFCLASVILRNIPPI